MVANVIILDPRYYFAYCYTDTAMPVDSVIKINGANASTSTVYSSQDGWNPGVSSPNKGVIGFSYTPATFIFGSNFQISNSTGVINVSSYAGVTSGLVASFDTGFAPSYPGSGSTWSDFSGYNNNSTLINSPTYSSNNDGILTFNGTNQYANVPYNSSFNPAANITVSVWVRNTATDLNIRNPIELSAASDELYFLYWRADLSPNKIGYGIRQSNSVYAQNTSTGSSFSTNTWYNFVLVANSSTGLVSLYVNGVLDSSVAYNGTLKQNSGATLSIGADAANNIRYWQGNISIVQIYNRALSLSEIQQNYNYTLPRFYSGPPPSATPTPTPTPAPTSTPTPTPSPAPNYATQKAIFGFGYTGSSQSITNLVSNTGVVASNTTGVGTARHTLAAAGYGTDKAIFGYGLAPSNSSLTNLVSNTGVVATNTTGVGTPRESLAAVTYGIDKAMFGYGYNAGARSMTNLVSNTGVVATDTTGVGTARYGLAGAKYGSSGTAIFAFGSNGTSQNVSNLISNTGVVATDTAGVGTARSFLAAANYATDKAIFCYGSTNQSTSGVFQKKNLVSNTGVIATDDVNAVGTARYGLAAATYGGNKAIFGYGMNSSAQYLALTNLVDVNGNVGFDNTGVGTARMYLAAAGYSLT